MSNAFFEQPILNSPYSEPTRHWEFSKEGLPTGREIAQHFNDHYYDAFAQASQTVGEAP